MLPLTLDLGPVLTMWNMLIMGISRPTVGSFSSSIFLFPICFYMLFLGVANFVACMQTWTLTWTRCWRPCPCQEVMMVSFLLMVGSCIHRFWFHISTYLHSLFFEPDGFYLVCMYEIRPGRNHGLYAETEAWEWHRPNSCTIKEKENWWLRGRVPCYRGDSSTFWRS